jgi:xanthine/CO dehydrogenase XdhC/CoxF family maturation factor
MDREFLQQICQVQNNGETAALIIIVETHGSTPRKAGSKMLVWPDGRSVGTIGGGCGEAEVRRQALTALDDNRSRLYTVKMQNSVAADEGMVCGGVMEVFIQIIQQSDCEQKEGGRL